MNKFDNNHNNTSTSIQGWKIKSKTVWPCFAQPKYPNSPNTLDNNVNNLLQLSS